jgi:hypothetical protein
MADFCHDYEPGGIGCGVFGKQCPEDCLGDFTASARAVVEKLPCNHHIVLGICEGCDAMAVLSRDDSGTFWFEHHPFDGTDMWTRKWRDDPELKTCSDTTQSEVRERR